MDPKKEIEEIWNSDTVDSDLLQDYFDTLEEAIECFKNCGFRDVKEFLDFVLRESRKIPTEEEIEEAELFQGDFEPCCEE